MEGLAAAAQGRKPVAAGPEVPKASIWEGINLAGRQEASLLEMAKESLLNATSWITAQGALARRLRAGGSDREKIRIEPTPREREAAKKLQLLVSSASAREALEKGKLLSLGAQLKGREGQGTVVVDGRLKRAGQARLLGIKELVVIMPSEQLALLVMTDAHREDHRRSVQDVTARARRHIWIPRGGPLAGLQKDGNGGNVFPANFGSHFCPASCNSFRIRCPPAKRSYRKWSLPAKFV